MSDRLLYQSEAEQLVLERGLVVAEPEFSFFRSFRDLWNLRTQIIEHSHIFFVTVIAQMGVFVDT